MVPWLLGIPHMCDSQHIYRHESVGHFGSLEPGNFDYSASGYGFLHIHGDALCRSLFDQPNPLNR